MVTKCENGEEINKWCQNQNNGDKIFKKLSKFENGDKIRKW